MESTDKYQTFNRRDFIKISSLAAASAALMKTDLASASQGNNGGKRKFISLSKKEYNTIDEVYEISPEYQRMDQKNIIFARGVWDRPLAEPEGIFKSFFAKWIGKEPR